MPPRGLVVRLLFLLGFELVELGPLGELLVRELVFELVGRTAAEGPGEVQREGPPGVVP
jgi:hypothetical protein